MADRRKMTRWALHVPIKVRFLNGDMVHADLIDLSIEGCRLQTSGAHRGDHVILRIANFAPLSATVAWAEDEFAGLCFDVPLHEAILDHVLAGECTGAGDVEELRQIAWRCSFLAQQRGSRQSAIELGALARDCRVAATIAALNQQLA